MPMCCTKAEFSRHLHRRCSSAELQRWRALQINISPVLHEVGDTAVSIGDDLISISNTGQVTIGGGGSGGSGSGGSGGGSTSSGGATVAASG